MTGVVPQQDQKSLDRMSGLF